MTILEQIAALANAGFTKAEILAMSQPKAAPQPEPKPEPQPKPQPEPQPKPAPQPNDNVMDETRKLFDAIGLKLDTLTSAVQTKNMDSGNSSVEETVDDILASIINPPGGAK